MSERHQNNAVIAAAGVSEIAESEGMAVVLVSDSSMAARTACNDNSICSMLSSSDEFSAKCQRYCGRVYDKAVSTDKPQRYRCHAGLDCIAVPLKLKGRKPLVAITGRAFTKADEYRKATVRAISGDWRGFPPTGFFENVLLSSSSYSIEKAARKIAEMGKAEKVALFEASGIREISSTIEPSREKVGITPESKIVTGKVLPTPAPAGTRPPRDAREASSLRSLLDSIKDQEYRDACRTVVRYVAERYEIDSIAWLEVEQNSFEKVYATGPLREQRIQISVAADDKALLRLFETESSIELKERGKGTGKERGGLRLFPISTAGAIRSGLVIGGKSDREGVVRSIAGFCRSVAGQLELLRLREEVSRRSWLDSALVKFNESLKLIDTANFWSRLLETTAELMQAERGSLMIWDEDSEKLVVKAALGKRADVIRKAESGIGERIALKVWHTGRPVVISDIGKLYMAEAPSEWKYATKSFISYPLMVGEKKVGVINITDKVGGGGYDEFDLNLMHSIVPQIAISADRAILKGKAGEFEQLSVTDALTGLLNRRYLKQRLEEEIKRSNRHGFPMCFMMIDVDDFKSYNDSFLHPEGDKALKIVGNCLKDTLRGADVAVRYGGEEFSILLPQTALDEAVIIAERVRRRIESTRFPHRQITVSIGIASLSHEVGTVSKLIEAADGALFEAKKNGKNNVRVHDSGDVAADVGD